MKKIVSIILSLGLVLCILPAFSSSANAQTNVEPGFYVEHNLHTKLSDFTSMNKKGKKAVINAVIKSNGSIQLVMGTMVYDFKEVLGLPAGVDPTGTSLDEYNGQFTSPPVTQEFRILSIE